MKTQLFVIAAIAIVSTQAAYAARVRFVNESKYEITFGIVSKAYENLHERGKPGKSKVYRLAPGGTSETIDTGLHRILEVGWNLYGLPLVPSMKHFYTPIDSSAAIAGGRFYFRDAEGGYRYDFGLGRTSKGYGKEGFGNY